MTPLQTLELDGIVFYMQPSHTTSEDRYKTYVLLNVILYCTEKQAIYVWPISDALLSCA